MHKPPQKAVDFFVVFLVFVSFLCYNVVKITYELR